MELLFLYINNFKNIQNIGFNLSPRYRFDYNPDSRTLTSEPLDGVIQGFFGDQISNITGIIGMNGSGKSNLIELICLLTKSTGTTFSNAYLLVFQDGPEFTVRTNISNLNLPFSTSILDSEKTVRDLSVIYFSNVTDNKKLQFPDDLIDLSRNATYRPIGRRHTSETESQVNFIFSKYRELVDLPSPRSLNLSFRIFKITNHQSLELIKSFSEFHKLYLQLRRSNTRDEPSLRLKCIFRFSVLLFMLKSLIKRGDMQQRTADEFHSYNELASIFNLHQTDVKDLHNSCHNLERIIKDLMSRYSDLIPLSKSLVGELLDFNMYIDELQPMAATDGRNNGPVFTIALTDSAQNIFKRFSSIFSVPELVDADWGGLSSGHEAFLNLFAQFHSAIHRVSQHKNVLICIDEADLYLHPQWQRQFLNRIINFIPKIIRRSLQIVITTHSPFLVSDLPRKNLLLLRSAEDNNTELISKDDSMERTFGANIVDLFQGSFFLDKGTISEFALQKIKKAIDIAKSDRPDSKSLEEANYIANCIGDKLIRTKLLEMLSDAETR